MSRGPLYFRPAQPGDFVVVNGGDMEKPVEVLSAEKMDHLQSAAGRLIAVQNEVLGMPQPQQEWFFGKEGHSDAFDLAWWINIQLPKIHTQSVAQAERIVELDLALERAYANNENLLQNHNRIEETRDAILAALPEDAPCREPETGVSVADAVRDLVREKAEAEKRRDIALRALEDASPLAVQSARESILARMATHGLELKGKLATSEAARQKAEEELGELRRLATEIHDQQIKFREERDYARDLTEAALKNGDRLLAERDALRQGLIEAANAFGAAGSIAEKLYGRVRSFIDESVPGWIRGDDGPAYPLLNLSQFCNRSGDAARALLQENPATDNPNQGFWDRMDQNSKVVEQMPKWVKGSPVNQRPVERPIQVGDVYLEIGAERIRQDQQWGGPGHDDQHSRWDWRLFIENQSILSIGNDVSPIGFQQRMIKVAALSVAAIESSRRLSQLERVEDGGKP